ncbi:SBBP repeat-containing protein [Aetokthonos hydrillicola Thurmond2011]|jgi:hypothetical protein|uniref:SBBP repeat-containing protein n=1 Tax=Aetokthonos hydrillicola Thurmond2011 TaxID=2712845 RepID=A0AAP5IE66_9CYAN|nr:SBBP repeat-containing protein [Aetokthonos hydrillicola]MBW4588836.1 SBBP repeat-containing protein [Aetokthonos hydrillicola CCALA 1050]MDR9897300.1 SBBP repeat-containing protein [Aetokthonos hydrillicola Thurmond2011]
MTANLFNASFYRAANSDLKNLTDAQALAHFQNYGLNEGRTFSPFVDLNFYRASNPDLEKAGIKTNKQLFDHLQKSGVAEGRRFSPVVDINFYLKSNGDVNTAFKGNREQAFTHLQNQGVGEGRKFSQFFDTGFYLARNSDLKTAFGGDRVKALQHLAIYGLKENREFSDFFNINYYRSQNSDLQKVGYQGIQLLEHFETYGLREGRSFSLTFDVNYYRKTYPDLVAAGLSNQQLYDHFQLYGLKEGRASSQSFNVKYYLANNTDLQKAGFSYAQAYDHFLLYGEREKRSGVTSLQSQWTRQFGTSGDDESFGVAVDGAGNVYITGYTNGSLAGNNSGKSDAWVAKYDKSGAQIWKKQLGTAGNDAAYGIGVDSAGNVYISGTTEGALKGTNSGGYDVWLAKYDSSGVQKWLQQFGTSTDDGSNGITVDNSGNVYVTGYTTGALGGASNGNTDAWVAKYDNNGAQKWLKQLGTSGDDESNSVAVDSAGNVYITGYTEEGLGGGNSGKSDAWVAKYDSNGTQKWVKQLGTSEKDQSNSVAVDSTGNVYITGDTEGALGGPNSGNSDAWVAKYDNNGVQKWLKQIGTSGKDGANGVTVDSIGNVYISGSSNGSLAGNNAGGYDAWIVAYDSNGAAVRKRQLSTSADDQLYSVTVDNNGNVYITGATTGAFAGTNAGNYDIWVAKLA